ncbi:hypothetical protein [Deferribacter autotrophicus]|nr:hypothetical protein [Deferribacter autotrophicus]
MDKILMFSIFTLTLIGYMQLKLYKKEKELLNVAKEKNDNIFIEGGYYEQ